MTKRRLLFWLAIPGIFALLSLDIVRRHDKNDEEYLTLGSQFPSVGKVSKRGGDGTLIAPRWVLTAGHVGQGMFERKGEDLKVYFEGIPDGIKVERVFVHPDFSPMAGADIALLLLSEEVNTITPSPLYEGREERGKNIVIVGHGYARTGKGGEWNTDGKRRAATNIIDDVDPGTIIFDFDEPGEGTELEGTAGPGDSGGPAYIKMDDTHYIAGVSSAGMEGKNGPGTYGATEFYTRVSSYLRWIQNILENPDEEKALKKGQTMERPGVRVVTGRPDGGPMPLPGLGLFLMQEGKQIRIGGKADPEVPKAFRQVMFKPPSYLKAFNGVSYSSLKEFQKEFKKLSKGDKFTIQFEIQGESRSFEALKM